MPKTWKITLDSDQLDRVIADLDDYSAKLNERLNRLAERVATHIRNEAQQGFDRSMLNDSRDLSHVTVSIEGEGPGQFLVFTNGEDAAFIEFGAGVHYNGAAGTSPHPMAPPGMTIGSYGKGNGAKDSWAYIDDSGYFVRTHGTPATMPLYNALLATRAELESFARSYFAT